MTVDQRKASRDPAGVTAPSLTQQIAADAIGVTLPDPVPTYADAVTRQWTAGQLADADLLWRLTRRGEQYAAQVVLEALIGDDVLDLVALTAETLHAAARRALASALLVS